MREWWNGTRGSDTGTKDVVKEPDKCRVCGGEDWDSGMRIEFEEGGRSGTVFREGVEGWTTTRVLRFWGDDVAQDAVIVVGPMDGWKGGAVGRRRTTGRRTVNRTPENVPDTKRAS